MEYKTFFTCRRRRVEGIYSFGGNSNTRKKSERGLVPKMSHDYCAE